ncbi:MAG: hypothetical protein M1820_000071 [Bogoriella megaspora]|nr:MAG: hypothetical protein M1820_000071 [Bogoriella megaspora]
MDEDGLDGKALQQEAIELERRLQEIRTQLNGAQPGRAHVQIDTFKKYPTKEAKINSRENMDSDVSKLSLHALLLLSDSSLPLGSFAFSNGLESFLAHNRTDRLRNNNTGKASVHLFHPFLKLSLLNTASTTLPFLLAAYRDSSRLESLDDIYDASIICTVARRASVAQGRALMGVWEKSLASAPGHSNQTHVVEALRELAKRLRTLTKDPDDIPSAHAHFGPVFGVVAAALSIPDRETAYTFLLSHAKAVLSAGVRAGVLGPFASQAILAGQAVFMRENQEKEVQGMMGLRELIDYCITKEWNANVEDAGITVPAIDLWQGRHELLYSRIFNS